MRRVRLGLVLNHAAADDVETSRPDRIRRIHRVVLRHNDIVGLIYATPHVIHDQRNTCICDLELGHEITSDTEPLINRLWLIVSYRIPNRPLICCMRLRDVYQQEIGPGRKVVGELLDIAYEGAKRRSGERAANHDEWATVLLTTFEECTQVCTVAAERNH